jgi:hypothetical protein
MLNNLQYQCVSGLILSRGRSIQAAKSLKLRGLGIREPDNFSYPEALWPYLNRAVFQCRIGNVEGNWFVKPIETKSFTGFVYDDKQDVIHLSEHDLEQRDVLLSLPPETPVWVSEPVTWLSEFRYYVIDGEVRGEGRYDDGPDDVPVPDYFMVMEMVETLSRQQDAPAAYSLDVGVLSSGETALVEVNDAWALGFYTGSLSYRDYIEMLWRRWDQLARKRERDAS